MTTVCIPLGDQARGGLYTFLRGLRSYCVEHGITLTERMEDDYDALLVPAFMVPYDEVLRIKRRPRGPIIVHRIDGAAQDYGRFDGADRRQARLNLLADLTIFQSDYGRHATREKFRVISQDGPVIHNAVDLAQFRPSDDPRPADRPLRIGHVSFSTNQRKGVASVLAVARRHPQVEFHMIGRYDDRPDLDNLFFPGVLDGDELAAAYRSCDLFLTFSENEACPNVVLEAMASGLPVLYLDSGGVPELVGEGGAPVTVDNFDEVLARVESTLGELGRISRSRAEEHFSPEVIFGRYLEEIVRATRRPLPGPGDFWRLFRQGFPVHGWALGERFVRRLRRTLRPLKSALRRNRSTGSGP